MVNYICVEIRRGGKVLSFKVRPFLPHESVSAFCCVTNLEASLGEKGI